ncbi:MAG: phage baseplate assembly protein V [Blastocatellia bacterium]|nr:phage baseplate assembly protein V [Blastocatellia bacterium]
MNILDLIADEPEYSATAGKIYGVVIGIVTNNRDPENLGRVKVRFPWLDETEESHWARVVLMGGKDRGIYFLPEVDDEVPVLFEHGDVRFPYVLGSLWNGEDPAPRNNSDGKNNERVIRSRSGHEIVFNDDDSQKREHVEIHTNGGHQILLDDSAGQEKILVKDKTGTNLIEIDSVQGSITISSQTKLGLKSQIVEIEAGAMMTIKAGATLTIQGALVKIN